MNVDVNFFGWDVEKQCQHSMPVAGEHIGIGAAHRPDQQAILHRPAVDEQVLVIGHPAVERWQSRHAGQPGEAAFRFHRDAIVGEFARDQPGDPVGQPLAGLHRQRPPAVVLKGEPGFGARHRQAPDDVEAGGIFGAGAAQELAPRRDPPEQVLNPDPRTRRQRGGSIANELAVVDHPAPTFRVTTRTAFDGQPGHAGD